MKLCTDPLACRTRHRHPSDRHQPEGFLLKFFPEVAPRSGHGQLLRRYVPR